MEVVDRETRTIVAPVRDDVKIGIRVDVKRVTIGAGESLSVTDISSGKSLSWPSGEYVITADNGVLHRDGKPLGQKMRFQSTGALSFIRCNDLGYRGTLIVRAKGDTLTVVNELGIDDYLKGVLPREAVVTWHDQALRVQAVASRTYLASHLGRHSDQGFDLCSDVHCQVFGGVAKEHPNTSSAVDATSGQILVYDGKAIGAFFHASCGGSTDQILPVWGTPNRPYLQRRSCPYCAPYPRRNWRVTLSDDYILGSLRKKTKVSGEELRSLKIRKKSGAGRVETIAVTTDKGTFTMSGNDFRIALHPEKIRSMLLTEMHRHGKGYTFAGRGWGHGVGMCQWGAKGQAEKNRSYPQILNFYYPGAKLAEWSRK